MVYLCVAPICHPWLCHRQETHGKRFFYRWGLFWTLVGWSPWDTIEWTPFLPKTHRYLRHCHWLQSRCAHYTAVLQKGSEQNALCRTWAYGCRTYRATCKLRERTHGAYLLGKCSWRKDSEARCGYSKKLSERKRVGKYGAISQCCSWFSRTNGETSHSDDYGRLGKTYWHHPRSWRWCDISRCRKDYGRVRQGICRIGIREIPYRSRPFV